MNAFWTELLWRWHNWKENLLIRFVWLLPRSVIYWTAIRIWVHANSGPYSAETVQDTKLVVALDRWLERHDKDPK